MLYNHMPDWIYASKDLSPSAKLLMARIFTLSKDGTQTVFIKRAIFAEQLGMSVRTLSNAFKELENQELIKTVPNPNAWDRTRNFEVTPKACKDTMIVDKNQLSSSDTKEKKNATSKLQNLQDRTGNNCNIEIAKTARKEEKLASCKLQNLQLLHQIEIKNDKERNIYSTKQKNEIPQKKRTAYRKQSSNYNYNKSNFYVENQPHAQVGRFHSSFLMNEEAKNLFAQANT